MSASYTYSVSASDVAAELPGIDDANIGASTEPLSTTDLTAWISEGAAKMNAIAARSGIDTGVGMDADAHEAIAGAVKAYVVHKALAVLGVTGELLTGARDRWNTVYAEYSNRPQQLGSAYADALSTSVDTATTTDSWSFIDSEGSIW